MCKGQVANYNFFSRHGASEIRYQSYYGQHDSTQCLTDLGSLLLIGELNDFSRQWIFLKSPVIIFKNIVEDSKRIVTKNLVFLIFVASIYKTKIDTNIKVIDQ